MLFLHQNIWIEIHIFAFVFVAVYVIPAFTSARQVSHRKVVKTITSKRWLLRLLLFRWNSSIADDESNYWVNNAFRFGWMWPFNRFWGFCLVHQPSGWRMTEFSFDLAHPFSAQIEPFSSRKMIQSNANHSNHFPTDALKSRNENLGITILMTVRNAWRQILLSTLVIRSWRKKFIIFRHKNTALRTQQHHHHIENSVSPVCLSVWLPVSFDRSIRASPHLTSSNSQ